MILFFDCNGNYQFGYQFIIWAYRVTIEEFDFMEKNRYFSN